MTRKELLPLMPKNKHDSKSAKKIVEIGYPEITPVLKDMLLWLRVTDSEVADTFTVFFAQLKPPQVELISKHIRTKSSLLRNRILIDILPYWSREAVTSLKSELTTYASHPDTLNNDLSCFKLIIKYDLADKDWVKEWLSFRKNQAIERLELMNSIEKELL